MPASILRTMLTRVPGHVAPGLASVCVLGSQVRGCTLLLSTRGVGGEARLRDSLASHLSALSLGVSETGLPT